MNYSHIFAHNIILLVLEYEFKYVCVHPQSYLTLCDPVDWSPLGSSFHRTFQAGILEWVAISSLRISQPRILVWVAIPSSRDLPRLGD